MLLLSAKCIALLSLAKVARSHLNQPQLTFFTVNPDPHACVFVPDDLIWFYMISPICLDLASLVSQQL